MARYVKQIKLDGTIAKDKTYFNHPAKTPYEKCVEACYFFNKATNSKQECLQKAQELWKSKYNDQALKTYIEKHETALKSRSVRVTKSFFKTVNIRAEKTVVVPTPATPALIPAVPNVADISHFKSHFLNRFEMFMIRLSK